MTFNPEIVEANLALSRIGTPDMPKLAWDAIESGFDGPATRRLAALESPTFFQVREILPRAMQEWGLKNVSQDEAAVRLAKNRARQILESDADPLAHTGDFEQIWIESDHCPEIASVGNLDDEVYVARSCGQSYEEIRAWVLDRIKQIADR